MSWTRPGVRRRGVATPGPGPPLDASGRPAARGRGRPRARHRPGRRWWCRPGTVSCTSSCRRWRSWRSSSSWSGCSSAAAGETGTPVDPRGLRAAARPADQDPDGHPRPRGDRGQRAPDVELDRAGRADPQPVRDRPRAAGSAPRPSPSTGGTAAPAAATTSPSAARSRRSRRCSAGPTCWSACSPTGSTTRRCRTCSPAGSSARPARRRGWTRAGRRPCTSWRSRSPRSTGSPTIRRPEHRPWAVDRALRHLLTDITGNTHRAEFCIDKLYSPDSLRGRLGLLELRGFEMPPHPDMALVQALLVRALVARFAEEPYSAPAGPLGHRAARAVPAAALRDGRPGRGRGRSAGPRPRPRPGLVRRRTWSSGSRGSGHRRRPASSSSCGRRSSRGTCSGEEATSGGTARYVDSSTERLQVEVTGFAPARHLLTCNGAAGAADADRHPGRATSRASATRPGSRGRRCTRRWRSTRRWPSTSSTGPAGVSLGGATYHVVHPGGRSYDHPPVNAAGGGGAAGAPVRGDRPHHGGDRRRGAGRARWPGAPASRTDYPLTLDLRRRLPPALGSRVTVLEPLPGRGSPSTLASGEPALRRVRRARRHRCATGWSALLDGLDEFDRDRSGPRPARGRPAAGGRQRHLHPRARRRRSPIADTPPATAPSAAADRAAAVAAGPAAADPGRPRVVQPRGRRGAAGRAAGRDPDRPVRGPAAAGPAGHPGGGGAGPRRVPAHRGRHRDDRPASGCS